MNFIRFGVKVKNHERMTKIKIVWKDGFVYCPYLPDINIKSNCETFIPEVKVGFKQRKKENEK